MKTNHYIKTGLVSAALYSAVIIGSIGSFSMAHATELSTTTAVVAQTVQSTKSGDFVQKSKTLKGNWQILKINGQTVIRFDDNFKAKRGPDLKIFLSPQGLDSVTGRTATNGAILLGELKSTRGSQDYVVPEGVTLSSFNSLLVHCEAFSVLWGGGAL